MPSIKRKKNVPRLPLPCEQDKPLSAYSTLGIGGPARYFSEVATVEEMQTWISYCVQERLRYIVIGKGSNCLFADQGFDGLVLLNKIGFCHFDGSVVHVGAGYSFSLLGVQTARQKWSGLEFASGIPGSVGGAIYMNAGANGMETKDVLLEVVFLDEKGARHVAHRDQIRFGYRLSSFQERACAILSGKFLLQPSQEARKKQLEIVDYRIATQPYGELSAGCFFSNPPGHSAGALIDRSGLKGASVGGAEVSCLHANFILNKSGATAKDILTLAKHVQKSVADKTGIALEMEVRYIPYDEEGDVPR
jgi:UDP-N-acetylmuramate dehydrogenase